MNNKKRKPIENNNRHQVEIEAFQTRYRFLNHYDLTSVFCSRSDIDLINGHIIA